MVRVRDHRFNGQADKITLLIVQAVLEISLINLLMDSDAAYGCIERLGRWLLDG